MLLHLESSVCRVQVDPRSTKHGSRVRIRDLYVDPGSVSREGYRHLDVDVLLLPVLCRVVGRDPKEANSSLFI